MINRKVTKFQRQYRFPLVLGIVEVCTSLTKCLLGDLTTIFNVLGERQATMVNKSVLKIPV